MHRGFPVVAAKQVVPLAEPLGVLVQEAFQQFACYVWTGPRATQNSYKTLRFSSLVEGSGAARAAF